MTSYKCLLCEVQRHVALITINRPQVLNAIDRTTMQEIEQALQTAMETPEVRVMIITGAGDGAFSAGADIHEMAGWDALEGDRVLALWERAEELIELLAQACHRSRERDRLRRWDRTRDGVSHPARVR